MKTTHTKWLALQFQNLALDLVNRGHERCHNLPEPADRDTHAEGEALQRLAAWCYQYSSQVSIISHRATLLLEIGASRQLFGAAEELTSKLSSALLQLGYHTRAGTAPTPEAAQLAARHGLHITHNSDIQLQIQKLPLESLELEPAQVPALLKMGFRTIGEVLNLPRKALSRRIGPAAVDYLDRLTGSRPDPQLPWKAPEHFVAGMDLAAEISTSQALLFPLKRLVSELCGVLRAHDRGVQELNICLRLDRGDDEQMRLGLQQATRDESHILLLLRERLERLRLPRPVRHIQLQAGQLLPFDAQPESLFRDNPDLSEQPVHPLLERLRARLGNDAVRGLRGIEDHRPEYSWAVRELDEPADCTAMPHRPIWLFASPQRCRIDEYQVLAGPERIEAGWWDGHDCRRDYFVVRDRNGCTLWAFREYKPEPGWYLQGMFA
ncbi:MAG: protein ImuB [Lysobacterales bacterium]